MNKQQQDNLRMYMATHDVLSKNASIYAGNVPFIDAVNSLKNGITGIQNLVTEQNFNSKGVTQDKKLRRDTLKTLTLKISGVIAFYASNTGNIKLLQRAKINKSTLNLCRENELPGYAKTVLQCANENAAALVAYGITPAIILELENANSQFVDYVSKPASARLQKKDASTQLKSSITQVTALLTQKIDSGMALYQNTHNKFYTQYKSARSIVNSPRITRALKATVIDSNTLQPLGGAEITINKKIKRKSSAKGTIHVQSLTEGNNKLTAIKKNYNTVQTTFIVVSGQTTRLTISMTKA